MHLNKYAMSRTTNSGIKFLELLNSMEMKS